ncbi:MAG: hypothetical protein EXR70_05235 [Deltaproteobacteria bacterium]|nr:hypothetical protein [Deltaproteobacteria bacterium]
MRVKIQLKSSLTVLAVSLLVAAVSWAGPQHQRIRPGFVALPPLTYYYPYVYQRWPSYPSVVVISPYAPFYYTPPAVVVSAPFFCTFDNHGFVSRIGLLDHLAGIHKIPLEAAVTLCPSDSASCVFPSY